MARFQGNVHAGSDRAAATLLVLLLVIAVLLAGWYMADQSGFVSFWDGIGRTITNR